MQSLRKALLKVLVRLLGDAKQATKGWKLFEAFCRNGIASFGDWNT